MKDVFDFLMSALPWVAIGLLVATSCMRIKAKTEGKEVSKFLRVLCWAPALCFLFASIMEMYIGNKSNGSTWLVLVVFNAVLNFANS